MSTRESDNFKGRSENPVEGGVLAALPRTRPQRASPRRAAARKRAGKDKPETAPAPVRSTPKAAASPKTARKTTTAQSTRNATPAAPITEKTPSAKANVKTKTVKTKPVSAKASLKVKVVSTSKGKPAEAPAPKQGYEPEEEVELGKTVNPPSGVELVESVADIFGELANSSLAAGGRILKDAFSLLRRP